MRPRGGQTTTEAYAARGTRTKQQSENEETGAGRVRPAGRRNGGNVAPREGRTEEERRHREERRVGSLRAVASLTAEKGSLIFKVEGCD